jgi:hypothetical protein
LVHVHRADQWASCKALHTTQPCLRHAHQGVVHGLVAVRVELAQHRAVVAQVENSKANFETRISHYRFKGCVLVASEGQTYWSDSSSSIHKLYSTTIRNANKTRWFQAPEGRLRSTVNSPASPTTRAHFLNGFFESSPSSCMANKMRRCTGLRPGCSGASCV